MCGKVWVVYCMLELSKQVFKTCHDFKNASHMKILSSLHYFWRKVVDIQQDDSFLRRSSAVINQYSNINVQKDLF